MLSLLTIVWQDQVMRHWTVDPWVVVRLMLAHWWTKSLSEVGSVVEPLFLDLALDGLWVRTDTAG